MSSKVSITSFKQSKATRMSSQSLHESKSDVPPKLPNPFRGLRRFEIDDSSLFFGRDEQTYEVLRRLRLLHFVAVLGPSGCGKSSLIRAGVLAALQGGYM